MHDDSLPAQTTNNNYGYSQPVKAELPTYYNPKDNTFSKVTDTHSLSTRPHAPTFVPYITYHLHRASRVIPWTTPSKHQ